MKWLQGINTMNSGICLGIFLNLLILVPQDYSDKLHALLRAAEKMNPHSAAGLDGWTPDLIRRLPGKAAPLLIRIFELCVRSRIWPTRTLAVRTQLIPKIERFNDILGVDQWRPIAVCSCWIRLWSQWQLELIHPILAHLDPHLVEGFRSEMPMERCFF